MMIWPSTHADAITVRTHDAVPVVEVLGDLDLRDLRAFEAALDIVYVTPDLLPFESVEEALTAIAHERSA